MSWWIRKQGRDEKVFPSDLYSTAFYTNYTLMRRGMNKGGGRK